MALDQAIELTCRDPGWETDGSLMILIELPRFCLNLLCVVACRSSARHGHLKRIPRASERGRCGPHFAPTSHGGGLNLDRTAGARISFISSLFFLFFPPVTLSVSQCSPPTFISATFLRTKRLSTSTPVTSITKKNKISWKNLCFFVLFVS